MQIQTIPIEQIKPNPLNNNKHSEEQIERLCKLIDYQSFRVPIIISKRSGYLVAGHGRVEAAKKLGVIELPVIYQDFDSHDQEYAFLTSDNSIAAWAEIDFTLLNDEMQHLGPDFDLELLGIADLTLDPSEKDEKKSNKEMIVQCPSCANTFDAKTNKA